MATPRTLGHFFLRRLILWYTRPAFRIGLSVLAPPAINPGNKWWICTNSGSAVATQGLSGTRWESDSGPQPVLGVTNDGGVATSGTSQSTLISGVLLNVADDRTLRDLVDWQHVSGSELSYTINW
jgi:hypothetical protein